MKVLQVLDQAFRTTVEEQDDTILWLTQSMQGAGANLKVLLSGSGVEYAVQKAAQPALSIGAWQQSQPADITRDIGRLVDKDVPIYAVEEDLAQRGLDPLLVNAGVSVIKRGELATLYQSVDQVWHW
jgi:sulfur relay (sulfurtransferase) DsrF/TusC family protein